MKNNFEKLPQKVEINTVMIICFSNEKVDLFIIYYSNMKLNLFRTDPEL